MKRGDVVALLIFSVQSVWALLWARRQPAELPGLGDHYFNIPLDSVQEALQSIRTLGYPLFHAAMARAGWGLETYPLVQMTVLVGCTAILGWGLRRYGFTGLTSLVAVSPLLWVVPADLIMPETLAKCFAIAAMGCLLWAAGTRSRWAYFGLALSIFVAYQMRPAFLFLLVLVPLCWLFLYTRRWGLLNGYRWLRNGGYTLAACTAPLFFFCLLRLLLVGHFGLVSFGGQNIIGISIEMLSPATVEKLPVADRPLAMAMTRARENWPTDRFVSTKGTSDDWLAISLQYTTNVNRIGRAVQSRFPASESEEDNVNRDKALSRMSQNTFRAEGELYLAWLTGAIAEGSRVAVDMILGGYGGEGFGLQRRWSIGIACGVLCLILFTWPATHRAFGEGSRPFSGRATAVILLLASLFFLLKMLLVILVEAPIPRYVQAALFLFPSFVAVLCWERCVIAAAALFHRPYWYGQGLVAYPSLPDVHKPIPWRSLALTCRPGKRRGLILGGLCVILILGILFATREARFFNQLARDPESQRDTLIKSTGYIGWRDQHGASVIHYAALHGDLPLLDHLLADPAAQDTIHADDGASPLHWAVLGEGTKGVTATLLEHGYAADTPGPLGLSPLHLAALFDNQLALKELLDSGVDPNVESIAGLAPLHLVSTRYSAAILLDAGAHIDATDSEGTTPFLGTTNRDLAAYFLERGADINATDNWRSFVRQGTALHKAVYQGDVDRARWLIDHGANLNSGDLNAFSPLFYAIWRKDNAMIHLLLNEGANINHPGQWLAFDRDNPGYRFTDIYGKTIGRHPQRNTFAALVPDRATLRPLDWAAFLGNQDLIALLLNRGADPGLYNDLGMSPLHWALLARQGKAAKLLRKKVADPGVLESAQLPADAFEADVARGFREAPEAVPNHHSRLRGAAQRVVDEYNNGAPNVVEGEDGFLFARQDCAYLLQPDLCHKIPMDPKSGPSPALAVITDIHRQLAERDIHLIVVPVPIALEVYTDAFLPDWNPMEEAQPARSAFIAALRDSDVDAIDLLPVYQEFRAAHPDEPLYLKVNTHWNSRGIDIAAAILAEKIRPHVADAAASEDLFQEQSYLHTVGLPRLAKRLPETRQTIYRDTTWDVTRVLTTDGSPFQEDDASPLLVAGDSFTLQFNDLAGQLSARLAVDLNQPIAGLAAQASGPLVPRILARKGKAYIDRRKVIIWVFSASYIQQLGTRESWELLELP